jgi:O-antigen/teichoic acid export membrane protein
MESLRRTVRSNSSVSTISQAVSSARNVLFLVLSARALGVEDFGQVALVTAATITLNEILRAAASHPLALLFNDAPTTDDLPLERAVSFQSALAVAVGLGAATPALLFGAGALAIGAVAYIPVAVFDALRVGSINRGRPARALAFDAAWAVLLVPILAVALSSSASARTALLVWGATAAIVTVIGLLSIDLRPTPSAAVPYWHEVRSVARSLVLQVGLESIPTKMAALLIAAVAGATVAGSIRGAEVLLGGASMIYSGVAAASLRDGRRAHADHGVGHVVRLLAKRFGFVLAVLAANLGVALVLPDPVGRAILGDSWAGAKSIAPENAFLLAGLISFAAISVAIRSSLQMRALVRIDLVGAVGVLAVVPAVAELVGAEAALAANGVIVWMMVGLGAIQINRRLRDTHG